MLCFLRLLAFSALPAWLTALPPSALSAFIACIGLHRFAFPAPSLGCLGVWVSALGVWVSGCRLWVSGVGSGRWLWVSARPLPLPMPKA